MTQDAARLRYRTPAAWAEVALADFDELLRDHAFCERKAHASAMKFAARHPERVELVDAMLELATEELQHFRQCWTLLRKRGVPLGHDAPDPYVIGLREALRGGTRDDVLLEQLLTAGIIEARSCERMGLVATALQDEELRRFYQRLCAAEARHEAMFVRLALTYFDEDRVQTRLAELLDHEAELVQRLPWRASLH